MRRLFLKLFRRRRLARDLEAEMAFHREMAAASGNSIPFGNAAFLREQAFDLWRFNRIENLWRDLAYALRGLRKSPGLAATALLSLALGIGLNTAIFSLAVEFLLSEPSVRDAGSVVYIRQDGNSHMPQATLDALRRTGIFAGIAGEKEESFINFNNGTETRRIFAMQASPDFFTVLGTPMALGRGWNQQDPAQVAVLHPRFWRQYLSADPAIVGKAIRLDGRLYTVTGILPDNYRSLIGFGYAPDVFVPAYIEHTMLAAYARLKPGMSVDQANAALAVAGKSIERAADSDPDVRSVFHATPISGPARLGHDPQVLQLALFFAVLLAAVGLVLLIACVNVAGLLLARAAARRQEIAVRLALGASRGRLLQQLLSESLLLSLAGAGLGFLLALAAARAAAAVSLPFPVPIHLQIEPDWRVAVYAAALSMAATVASGLAPAWQALRESLAAGLRREHRLNLRRVLVVAQIAISFVVLATAALFLENLLRAGSLGTGFDLRHTIRAEVYLPPNEYRNAARIRFYADRALAAVRAVPGVESAAAASIIPFTDASTYEVDLTFTETGEKRRVRFNWNAVSPDFFHVMEIPVLRGRPFTQQDRSGESAAIVNDVFVRRFLAGHEPVGALVRWDRDQKPVRIVGVVRGTKSMTIGEDPRAQLYVPLSQIEPNPRMQFVARSLTPPVLQLNPVRQALRQIEPGAGLEVSTLFSAIGFAFLPSRVGAALTGSIGALGLLLALIGLYGVLAYSVTRRTREIGIRMAVGASAGDVSRLVLADFARLLAAGIAIGLVLAMLATRPLGMFLVPGLSASDPASFSLVAAALAATGALAALGPVRRAVRVNPLASLRDQ